LDVKIIDFQKVACIQKSISRKKKFFWLVAKTFFVLKYAENQNLGDA
jgi:hypothetical protein